MEYPSHHDYLPYKLSISLVPLNIHLCRIIAHARDAIMVRTYILIIDDGAAATFMTLFDFLTWIFLRQRVLYGILSPFCAGNIHIGRTPIPRYSRYLPPSNTPWMPCIARSSQLFPSAISSVRFHSFIKVRFHAAPHFHLYSSRLIGRYAISDADLNTSRAFACFTANARFLFLYASDNATRHTELQNFAQIIGSFSWCTIISCFS